MQARKRWSGYFGAAIAPDSNLNAASESEIVYIDTAFGRLPFTRDGDIGAESGLGISVWGGGEYRRRQPGHERLTLRLGADTTLREYPGGDFDQFFLASYAGPLWRLGPRTELSVLGTAQRQWLGSQAYADEFGGRLELDHQLTPGIWARGTAAYRQRDHLARDFLDGPVADFNLAFAWTPAPVLRVHVTVGYTRDHAASQHWRSLSRWVRVGTSADLAAGLHPRHQHPGAARRSTTAAGQARLTLYGRPRFDRLADVHRLGAQPRLHRVPLQPAVGAHPRRAAHQRAGAGLRPQPRRAALRAAVLKGRGRWSFDNPERSRRVRSGQ